MKSYDNVKNIKYDESANFSWVLNNQLDRISKGYSYGGIEGAIGGIQNLYKLLSSVAVRDKDFQKDLKKLRKKIYDGLSNLDPQNKNYLLNERVKLQFFDELYPALIRLMDRHGLLGQKTGDYIPDDDDEEFSGIIDGGD